MQIVCILYGVHMKNLFDDFGEAKAGVLRAMSSIR